MKTFLLIILGLVHAASGQTVECPGPYHAVGNGCYIFPDTQISWYDANVFCQFSGGYLVNIDSEAEQSALNSYHDAHFNSTINRRWIGLTDCLADGAWRLVPSGATVDYTNWNSGQPATGNTLNCAAWNAVSDNWNSWTCWDTYFYPLCETRPL